MNTVAPAKAVASFDSASAMLRATSLGLRGRSFPHLGRGRLKALPTRYAMALPNRLRRQIYGVFGGLEGIGQERLGDVDMEQVARWIVGHYSGSQYPGVVIGSSNGALVHLCIEAGMPFLPQTVLVPVHWDGNHPDRAADAMRFGERVAGPLLDRNPGIVLHHMHDGNQDRLMVSHMAYFRLKWQALPEAYREFLRDRLEPGAPIIVCRDDSTWPTVRVGERHVFQTGARGGLTADEYLYSSPRVAEFLQAQGSPYQSFQAPTADDVSPEAEWGFEAGLLDDLRAGWENERPVVPVTIPEPDTMSGSTATFLRKRAREAGADGDRLVVESFAMLDPLQVRRSGSVPYWSYFPVKDSLEHCAEHVEQAARGGDPYREIDVLHFPHGVASVGAAAPEVWERRLREHITGKVRFLSGTPERWPAHFDALAKYGIALAQLPDQPQPPVSLTAEELLGEFASDPATSLQTTGASR